MHKRIAFYLVAGMLMVPTLWSCGGRTARRDKSMSRYIESTQAVGRTVELISGVTPTLNDDFRQGDTVAIAYLRGADTTALDSVVLFIRGERMGRMEGVWRHVLSAAEPVGKVQFRVVAHQRGDSTVRVGEFAVKAGRRPQQYGYRVVQSFPHDKTAYTQGLFWHDGYLYESTGQKGESKFRRVDLRTGEPLANRDLDEKYFGEGAAILGDRIYQLTWQDNLGFIYDAKTLEPIGEFGYPGEGWGLTADGEFLYMSDGTEKIFVLDPKTFRRVRTIEVYDDQGRIRELNELEWVEGEIWANVYMTDRIVRIDPASGAVVGVIDLKRILPSADKDLYTDVLNGIAYDPATGRIFVTGKNWKKLFEIELVKQ